MSSRLEMEYSICSSSCQMAVEFYDRSELKRYVATETVVNLRSQVF